MIELPLYESAGEKLTKLRSPFSKNRFCANRETTKELACVATSRSEIARRLIGRRAVLCERRDPIEKSASLDEGQVRALAQHFGTLLTIVLSCGTLAGHTVSLRHRLPDGLIGVEFVHPPAVARAIGLIGDQHMGWTGLVKPDELTDIRVVESRRA